MRAVRLFCCALMVAAPAASLASEEDVESPRVVPYRPSVSTPADLSAPGWLEGEFGALRLKSRGENAAALRRDSLPYSLKLAFSPDWGVRIGGELGVRQLGADGTRETGFGDTAVVLKRRLAIDEDSAFGIELGANAQTAKRGLGTGSGKADYSATGIYSKDAGPWHTDLNLGATRFGAVDSGESRVQTAAAASLSRAFGERWGLVGEFSGTRQHGAPSTAQFLSAVNYSLSKSAVIDFGGARGLNHASPKWAVFVGATVLLGKVFSCSRCADFSGRTS